jgi:cyclin-dependent kinase 8/11
MADVNRSNTNKPEWLQQYDLIGKIGEGTYGLVFLARIKSNRGKSIAIKKFKQSKDGDGVSPTAIREIMVFFPPFFLNNFSPIFILQLMNEMKL